MPTLWYQSLKAQSDQRWGLNCLNTSTHIQLSPNLFPDFLGTVPMYQGLKAQSAQLNKANLESLPNKISISSSARLSTLNRDSTILYLIGSHHLLGLFYKNSRHIRGFCRYFVIFCVPRDRLVQSFPLDVISSKRYVKVTHFNEIRSRNSHESLEVIIFKYTVILLFLFNKKLVWSEKVNSRFFNFLLTKGKII